MKNWDVRGIHFSLRKNSFLLAVVLGGCKWDDAQVVVDVEHTKVSQQNEEFYDPMK